MFFVIAVIQDILLPALPIRLSPIIVLERSKVVTVRYRNALERAEWKNCCRCCIGCAKGDTGRKRSTGPVQPAVALLVVVPRQRAFCLLLIS